MLATNLNPLNADHYLYILCISEHAAKVCRVLEDLLLIFSICRFIDYDTNIEEEACR